MPKVWADPTGGYSRVCTGYMHTLSYFLKDFIYLFRESEREGDREEEKHQCVVVSQVSPTGDLAHNPGLCPGWEWN